MILLLPLLQAMGERVNQARSTIQYLKNTIEQVRPPRPGATHSHYVQLIGLMVDWFDGVQTDFLLPPQTKKTSPRVLMDYKFECHSACHDSLG